MSALAILYLNPIPRIGGAERSLLDLAAHLDGTRFVPRIACLGDGPLLGAAAAAGLAAEVIPVPAAFVRTSLRGRRASVLRIVTSVASIFPTVRCIRALVADHRVAIIHSNGNKTHLLATLAAVRSHARVVWHIRDFLPDRMLERAFIRLANLRADAVVANSHAVGRHLRRLGLRAEILRVIPNGIDCRRFAPSGPVADLRRECGWPDDCPVVGMVGAIARWKGHEAFLEAARAVSCRRPDVRYVIVGEEIYATDGHGNLKVELMRKARELGLDGRLAFVGHRDDVPEVMRALDVVVHASVDPEPFGRVVAEAMACGRRVVATDGGGVPEIVGGEPVASVALVPRGDPLRMADAVLTLLESGAGMADAASAARSRIAERFDVGRHVRSVEALYESLVAPRGLRVVHAGKFYPPSRGGMEAVVGQLCAGTGRRWDARAVVANEAPRTMRDRVDGVDVVRAATIGRLGALPVAPTLPWHLWTVRADCLVLHEPNPLAVAALLLRPPRGRFVIWHHADFLRPSWARRTYRAWMRSLYRRADCVVVTSPAVARDPDLLRHARRVEIIPLGIDVERYLEPSRAQMAEARAIRARYCSGPLVLFVGRLVYYKGLDVLLEAMCTCPGRLLVIGCGPLDASLRARATQLGLDSRVEFLGQVPAETLIAYYRAADVFVLPSTESTEAFGVVQVEAMACGVPVVSTDLSTGVPWVNEHGVTGLVVPPGDRHALARAIRTLLADPALRLKMGKAGCRRAAERFTAARMVADFIDVIESVVCGDR